jgi:hypothetical protein
MSKADAAKNNADRIALMASRPSIGNAKRRPELVWVEDWKDGELQRLRLYENGNAKNVAAWLTAEAAKPAEQPGDYPEVPEPVPEVEP